VSTSPPRRLVKHAESFGVEQVFETGIESTARATPPPVVVVWGWIATPGHSQQRVWTIEAPTNTVG
jgi:hypothetical protein